MSIQSHVCGAPNKGDVPRRIAPHPRAAHRLQTLEPTGSLSATKGDQKVFAA
jgi:hypothetical protein